MVSPVLEQTTTNSKTAGEVPFDIANGQWRSIVNLGKQGIANASDQFFALRSELENGMRTLGSFGLTRDQAKVLLPHTPGVTRVLQDEYGNRIRIDGIAQERTFKLLSAIDSLEKFYRLSDVPIHKIINQAFVSEMAGTNRSTSDSLQARILDRIEIELNTITEQRLSKRPEGQGIKTSPPAVEPIIDQSKVLDAHEQRFIDEFASNLTFNGIRRASKQSSSSDLKAANEMMKASVELAQRTLAPNCHTVEQQRKFTTLMRRIDREVEFEMRSATSQTPLEWAQRFREKILFYARTPNVTQTQLAENQRMVNASTTRASSRIDQVIVKHLIGRFERGLHDPDHMRLEAAKQNMKRNIDTILSSISGDPQHRELSVVLQQIKNSIHRNDTEPFRQAQFREMVKRCWDLLNGLTPIDLNNIGTGLKSR